MIQPINLSTKMNDSNQKDINDVETTNTAKEDIFRRLDKRKENLQQQRSANAGERSKNAAGLQDVLDKVCITVICNSADTFQYTPFPELNSWH